MRLTYEQFKALYKTSTIIHLVGNLNPKQQLDMMHKTAKLHEVNVPIGFLQGFMSHFGKSSVPNPYPHMSMAYTHFERGRISASYHSSYFSRKEREGYLSEGATALLET